MLFKETLIWVYIEFTYTLRSLCTALVAWRCHSINENEILFICIFKDLSHLFLRRAQMSRHVITYFRLFYPGLACTEGHLITWWIVLIIPNRDELRLTLSLSLSTWICSPSNSTLGDHWGGANQITCTGPVLQDSHFAFYICHFLSMWIVCVIPRNIPCPPLQTLMPHKYVVFARSQLCMIIPWEPASTLRWLVFVPVAATAQHQTDGKDDGKSGVTH